MRDTHTHVEIPRTIRGEKRRKLSDYSEEFAKSRAIIRGTEKWEGPCVPNKVRNTEEEIEIPKVK